MIGNTENEIVIFLVCLTVDSQHKQRATGRVVHRSRSTRNFQLAVLDVQLLSYVGKHYSIPVRHEAKSSSPARGAAEGLVDHWSA